MSRASTDLLLIRQGNRVEPYVPSVELSEIIWREKVVKILGVEYTNVGTCCEWLAVQDTDDQSIAGVSLLLFYPDFEKEVVAGLQGTNVLKDELEGAVILIRPTKNWRTAGGPCLPVPFLRGIKGQQCYFISEVLPDDPRLKIPMVEAEQTRV